MSVTSFIFWKRDLDDLGSICTTPMFWTLYRREKPSWNLVSRNFYLVFWKWELDNPKPISTTLMFWALPNREIMLMFFGLWSCGQTPSSISGLRPWLTDNGIKKSLCSAKKLPDSVLFEYMQKKTMNMSQYRIYTGFGFVKHEQHRRQSKNSRTELNHISRSCRKPQSDSIMRKYRIQTRSR